jgi:L-ascorbate metabolism protein UlaG (beta-lactamase superfamily)
MKVRYLGHSCVEISGEQHILIDPDFTREPLPDIDYICLSHAHNDHIGRITEVPNGLILAAEDVCLILAERGIPKERLRPVNIGERIANIRVLPGFSSVNSALYVFASLVVKQRLPEPAGSPRSFLIEDEASLLHIGDANEAALDISPDILCLPWRSAPLRSEVYQESLLALVDQFNPRYILPIHHDLGRTQANPHEIRKHTDIPVLLDNDSFIFKGQNLVTPPAEEHKPISTG